MIEESSGVPDFCLLREGVWDTSILPFHCVSRKSSSLLLFTLQVIHLFSSLGLEIFTGNYFFQSKQPDRTANSEFSYITQK